MPGPGHRRFALVAAFALCLAGCPESPTDVEIGAQPSSPPSPQDTTTTPPPTPPAAVPHATPVIFIATSSDASVYNRYLGDVIEGSRGAFVQIDPAAQEATLFHTSSSVSYAQSRTTMYTFDDDIYLLDVSDTGARTRRLDTDDLRAGSYIPVPTPGSLDSVENDCLVVQGDDLVYKVAYRRASFPGTGWADGPLVRVPGFFGGGRQVEEIMPGIGGDSPSPGGFVTDACQFKMDWADGVWYDVSNRPVDDALAIFERDPATGEPTPVATLPDISAIESDFSITNLGFDRGWVYFAALDEAAQEVGVFARDVADGQWALLGATPLTGFTSNALHSLDVDDGHVGFVMKGADGSDMVALYSSDADAFQTVAIGTSVDQLQVMYR